MTYHSFQESIVTEYSVMLLHYEFPVIKRTPRGVWLSVWGGKKFILEGARKWWACPTAAEALESYHARKRRQVALLTAQLQRAEAALKLTSESERMYFDEVTA